MDVAELRYFGAHQMLRMLFPNQQQQKGHSIIICSGMLQHLHSTPAEPGQDVAAVFQHFELKTVLLHGAHLQYRLVL